MVVVTAVSCGSEGSQWWWRWLWQSVVVAAAAVSGSGGGSQWRWRRQSVVAVKGDAVNRTAVITVLA